eukprot:10863682-Heterocapsa_arctica.AAC.1
MSSSSKSNVAGKKKGKVKNLVKKREVQAQKKEDDWAIWYAARHGHNEKDKNLGKAIFQVGKAIVTEVEKSCKAKKQQLIKKAKNLEVEGEGTGIELEGKGNEDEDDGEHLGDEHTSMSSDEDMQ